MIDPELPDDAPEVDARMLRQFAAAWLILFVSLSCWNLYHVQRGSAITFAVLALAVGPLGLVRPRAIQPLFATLIALTKPIGIVMTRLILGVVFYGLFTPIAIVFKVMRRDALNRSRDGGARYTYWVPRSLRADARRYFRQY
jgi:saxitoxin biosynthesis operon SxtJ-like protein